MQPVAAKVEVLDDHEASGSFPVASSSGGERHPGLPAVALLSAGRAYRVRCRVWGARPNNPDVTWWLRGKPVS